ncbi:MAG: T9SS type A sorting domain-containing protein, partial [Bacteroidia bacterium]
LLIENELLPNLFVEATEIRVVNQGGSRSALVQNTGGGTINWTATTPDSWISLVENSGINTGLLNFNTSLNPNPTETRSGVIYVEGNGQSDTLIVLQGEFDLVGSVTILNEIGLCLYPNPAVDQITISSKISLSFRSIKIYDLSGREMNVPIFNGVQGSAVVMVNKLSSGIYFVKIDTGEQEYTARFVKN